MTSAALLRPLVRLRAAVDADRAGLRQSVAALLISSTGGLLAGLTLGAITGTLEALPGLLVLIPAAIGMRGNIFGALGSRLGTAIHTGTLGSGWRRDTLVGQNAIAAAALTLSTSAALAVLAWVLAAALGPGGTISVADFLVISLVGGVLSSIVVLGITLAVAKAAVARGWDMDNVAAPLITAAGDVVTLPALFVATYLVGHGFGTDVVALLGVVAAVVALTLTWRSSRQVIRRIVRQSAPVLLVAGSIDVLAGLTIENRLHAFVAYPALLVLIPPFLEQIGALGGILSARLSSKLHLGVIGPAARPERAARDDILLIAVLAVPVFVLAALSAELASLAFGYGSPGVARMVLVAVLGGVMATSVALAVAYYGAIVTYRSGLDPDNYGIPLLTSSMDLVASISLILAIMAVGVG
jgi:mgtE-like transporter